MCQEHDLVLASRWLREKNVLRNGGHDDVVIVTGDVLSVRPDIQDKTPGCALAPRSRVDDQGTINEERYILCCSMVITKVHMEVWGWVSLE
jgi:hypothetical protein